MEKKSIKCSYAFLVIILFAALAFVTDYTFIERKISKCDCPKCSDNVVQNGNYVDVSSNDENVVENSNVDSNSNNNLNSNVISKDVAHNNMFGNVIVTKDGSVYFRPYEQYNFNFSGDFVKGTYSVDDYILGPESDQFEGYKLNTSNIRSASSFAVGNGGSFISVVLITKDNKVEIINFENSNGNNVDVTFKRVDNLSNIVSVVESAGFGGHGYVFYDVNGNQINN